MVSQVYNYPALAFARLNSHVGTRCGSAHRPRLCARGILLRIYELAALVVLRQ